MSRSEWIPLAEADRWRAALAGIEHGFTHLPEYSAAAAEVSGHAAGLWVWEGEAGRAVCPLMRRAAPGGSFDLATPPGFAGFAITGDVRELSTAWLREHGALAAYVQLSPALSTAEWRSRLPGLDAGLATSRECHVWDLRPTPESLLAGMSQTHRNLLRQWQRDTGGAVLWDRHELQPAFDRLYAGFLDRRGIGGAYAYTPQAIAKLGAAPGVLWVGARDAQGGIEAVVLFLWHGRRADTFLVAASDAGRRHSRALYWHGALRLRELGVEQLNLGGGVADGDALAQFKQRLGAPGQRTLALRQVLDPMGFQKACSLAGVAADAAGRFPPWPIA